VGALERFAAWRRRSRRALALTVLLSVAPACALWWCAVVYLERSAEESARGRMDLLMETRLRRLTGEVEARARWLRESLQDETLRAALEGWDGRPAGDSAEALREALSSRLSPDSPFETLFVGRGLETPVSAPAGTDLHWAGRALPTGARSSASLRVVAGPPGAAGNPLALAVPAAGRPGAWLGGLLPAGTVAGSLGGADGHRAFLYRGDGTLLAEEAAAGAEAPLASVAGDLRRRGGWWRGQDAAGMPILRLWRWMPAGIELALVTEMPLAEARAPLAGFHAVAGLVAVLALGLAALGVAVTLRAVARPVDRLERTLAQLGSGSLPRLPPDEPEEALSAVLIEQLQPRQEGWERLRRRARHLEDVAGRLADLALIGCTREGRVRTLSAGAARLLGRGEGALAGEALRDLFQPADWERLAPRLFGAGPEAAEVRERVLLRGRQGEAIQADLRVVCLEEPGEEGFLIVLQEVSPRTEREQTLAESEARLRDLVEGFSEGVALLRGERIEYANPALARLAGREAAALRGLPLADLVSARDWLSVVERVRGAAAGAVPAGSLEIDIPRTDGAGERRALLELGGGLGPGNVVATLRDITDLARARASVEQERRRLDLTLESTSDGILAVRYHRGGSSLMLANRRLAEIFGLEADELTSAESGAEIWQRLGRRLGAGDVWAGRAALFSAPSEAAFTERVDAGGGRTLEVFCGPIRDDLGRVVGRVATLRDISDLRRTERALRERSEELASSRGELERAHEELTVVNQDLERRTQELTRLNRELKSLDEMKSALLANVSHELQTPLVSVKGYTEMMLKEKLGPLNDPQRRGLEVSLKNVNRLIGLIDNLLSFSRLEGEMAELRLETFALRPLVDEVVETLRERAREAKVEISVSPRLDGAAVRADRDKISQVFVNLVSNAIKFNRPGGGVWIEAEPGRRGFIKIEVRDSGIGIPREALDKIFERFYQVDPSAARRQDGTGIGLSIVRNILRMHGCMIRADSTMGEGSVFAFTLPSARRARHERASGRAAGEEAAEGEERRERSRPSRPLGEEPEAEG
jgi:PAS domain S-box-containing protein